MPKIKGVKTLKELSLVNLVTEAEEYFGSNVTEPFNLLPSILLEDIIEYMKRKNLLVKENVIFVLTKTLKRLNLRNYFDLTTTTHILHLTTIRSPDLEVLLCKSDTALYKTLQVLPKLQELDISWSKIDDSCMDILGSFCTELRCLNLTGCPVTDDGVTALCVGDSGIENSRKGCRFINTLSVKKTKISQKGVQLAIENLPELKSFEFSRSVEILAEFYRRSASPESFKFECKVLSNSSPYERGNIRKAALMCSCVNAVHITMDTEVTDIELNGLLELKSLRKLDILCNPHERRDEASDPESYEVESNDSYNYDTEENDDSEIEENDPEITFEGGISPLLKTFGTTLTRLKLHGLQICVNILTIAELCPRIEQLSLCDNDSYSLEEDRQPGCSKRPKKELRLKNLKKLYYGSQNQYPSEFSPEVLLFLLSSPSLMDIEFISCQELNDEIIEASIDAGQFRKLKSLAISYCHSITKRGIDSLMNESNPLEKLIIRDSHGIIVENGGEEWRVLARQENWKFKLHFSRSAIRRTQTARKSTGGRPW